MATQTAEEVKDRHIKSMGPDLGLLFYLLKQDLFQVYIQWNEYVEAFGTSAERIDLLNAAAGGFAKSAQDALWADVLLGLTRLTDPPKSFRKNNLSVTRITELLEGELKQTVLNLLEVAIGSAEFARDWRNRYLAHRDLSHGMDSSATPLEEASRLKVRDCLAAVVAVMNEVESKLEDSTTMYSEARYPNGVVDLLYVIDDGLRVEEARRARLKAGTPLPEDYAQRAI